MKSLGMHLIWITVADIKSAIAFYRDVLGFTLHEFHEQYNWAELRGPEGFYLGIAQQNKMDGVRPGTNAVVTISVENINLARKELLEKKVNLIGDILEIPGEVKMQTFQDKDGNMFQLCERLRTNSNGG